MREDALRRGPARQECLPSAARRQPAALLDGQLPFEDCLLRDSDLGGAKLTGVSFPGSTLDGVRFAGARMADVDLRGAVRLGLPDGHQGLSGAVLNTGQLFELAPQFAHALGITVKDRAVKDRAVKG